jgi:hypothetical protein
MMVGRYLDDGVSLPPVDPELLEVALASVIEPDPDPELFCDPELPPDPELLVDPELPPDAEVPLVPELPPDDEDPFDPESLDCRLDPPELPPLGFSMPLGSPPGAAEAAQAATKAIVKRAEAGVKRMPCLSIRRGC